MKSKFRAAVAVLLSLAMVHGAMAADPATAGDASVQSAADGSGSNQSLVCPDAEIFGAKLITGICWNCIFPITLAGGVMKLGDPDEQKAPEDANDRPTCACPSNPMDPIPLPGLAVSFWEPARIIEVVRTPFCMASFGGTKIKDSWRGMGTKGLNVEPGNDTQTGSAKAHVHYMAFPILAMMNMLLDATCNPDGYVDPDLLYVTELDPTWSSDELALLTNFETMLFANPVALAACAVDAAASTAGYPMQKLFWCAGTWGTVYPMTGNDPNSVSRPVTSSLFATRMLAKLHRLGLARKYTGSETLCRAPFHPTLHKTQYKMSTLFPIVESRQNHWIGESSFKWGEWRNIPAAGEDHLYMLYRFNDCCFRL